MNKSAVGIVGATGYTGLELIRCLSTHPHVSITHLFANKAAGQAVRDVYPHLGLSIQLEEFDPIKQYGLDILFFATPHNTTHVYMRDAIKNTPRVIDLSADFRFSKAELFNQTYQSEHQSGALLSKFVYGIPELFRDKIANSHYIANPGCYPTSVILPLYPILNSPVIKKPVSVVIDAKSGVTGAGKSLKETSLYCEVNESFSAYGTGTHRHGPEIEAVLGVPVLFSPHLVPMNRGILSSIYLTFSSPVEAETIVSVLKTAYKNEPFIQIMAPDVQVSTKWVSGSNNAAIWVKSIEKTRQVVLFCAIDNLLKGAAGQAIQNMNVMLRTEPYLGLPRIAYYV